MWRWRRAFLAAMTLLAGPIVIGQIVPAVSARADDCVAPATTVVADLPWAQDWLRPQLVWPITQGAGATVAVLDTGVAPVPQLRDRVDPGIDLLTGSGRADSDCAGHGTFVAGLVAAAVRPEVGFAGVAPGARVLPIRLANSAQDMAAPALVAAGIRAAAQNGAKVILVGLPMMRAGADLGAALDVAAAHDSLVVTAAWGPANGEALPVDSAAAARLLSVGGFSTDGKLVSDVARPLDLLAPGGDLISIGPGGPGHLRSSGSEFAAAFVAGAAVLVRAAHPGLTAAQVKLRLTDTAADLALPGANARLGILDLHAATTAVLAGENRPHATVAASRRPMIVVRPVPADDSPFRAAVAVTFGAATIGSAAGVVAVLAARARRRREHAGGRGK
jgi:subtilisin family serine protease